MASLYEDLIDESNNTAEAPAKDVPVDDKDKSGLDQPASEGLDQEQQQPSESVGSNEVAAQAESSSEQQPAAEKDGEAPASEDAAVPAVEEEQKPELIFIGGLSWDTSQSGLRMYMETFGEVSHIEFKRGFAFVQFATKEAVEACLQAGNEQNVDGKMVEVKISEPLTAPRSQRSRNVGGYGSAQNYISRNNNYPSAQGGINPASGDSTNQASADDRDAPGLNVGRKVFVGGLAQDVREAELRSYMEHHGKIEDVVVMIDRNTGRSRGFGFVTFSTREEAETASKNRRQTLGGKSCEVKLYEPGARGNFHQSRTTEGGGPRHGGYQHSQTNEWNRHRPFSGGDRRVGGHRDNYTSYGQGGHQHGGGYGGQNQYYSQYYPQGGAGGYDYSQQPQQAQQQQQQWNQYDYSGGSGGGGWGYGGQQQGAGAQYYNGHQQQQHQAQPQQHGHHQRGSYQQNHSGSGGYSGGGGQHHHHHGGGRTGGGGGGRYDQRH